MSVTPTMAKRFIRPPRKTPEATKPFLLQPNPPSAAPKPEPRNIWMMIFPAGLLVGVVGTVIVMFTLRGSTWGFFFPGVTMFSMVGLMAISGGRFGRRQKRSWGEREQGRRDYLADLDVKRDKNQETSRIRFAEDRQANTPPAHLPKLIGGPNMWQRRPTDPDFLDVRLGGGVQEADQGMFNWNEMSIPSSDELEPVAGNALRKFMLVQTKIAGMGKIVNLRSLPGLGLVGEDDLVAGLARSMLCEIAAYHSPAEVKVAIVSHQPRRWDWVKWLPHNRHDELVDACGRRRLFFASPDEIRAVLADEIHSRDPWGESPPLRWNESGQSQTSFPVADSPLDAESVLQSGDAVHKLAGLVHWIIVDDNTGTAAQWDGITGSTGFQAVTFLRLAESHGTGVGFGKNQVFEVRYG